MLSDTHRLYMRRTVWLVSAVVICGSATGGLWLAMRFGAFATAPRDGATSIQQNQPSPPRPDDLSALDPAVAQLIDRTVQEVSDDPGGASGWFKLGMVYAASELYELATACYEQSVQLDSRKPRCWYHLGLARASQHELDEAIAAVNFVTELAPSFAPAQWRLGLWRLDQANLDLAKTHFRKALDIDGQESAAWVGLAQVHLQRSENQAAAEVLSSFLGSAKAPRNVAYANGLLATAYQRLGRTDEAQAALRRGKDGEADWTDPWQRELLDYRPAFGARMLRANKALERNRIDEALALYRQLRREQPDNPVVLTKLGTALGKKGRFDESITMLNQAVALDPSDFVAHLNLGYSYAHKSRLAPADTTAGFLDLAMKSVRRALQINPSHGPAYGFTGDLLLLRGGYDDAIGAYERAAELDGRNPQWIFQAALIEIRLHRWAESTAQLERLTRNVPDHGDGWRALGVAQMNLGRLDDAQRSLAQAQRFKPDDPALRVAFHLLAKFRRDAADSSPSVTDKDRR